MLVVRYTVLSGHPFYPLANREGKRSATIASANRKNVSEEEESPKSQGLYFPLKLSRKVVAQSAIALFALGFIDAGYSGDWSRIGVLSKSDEELLKIAAFIVVPFCIFIILSFSFTKKIR